VKGIVVASLILFGSQIGSAQYDTLHLRNRVYHLQRQLHQAYKTHDASIVMLGNSITYGANWSELLGRPDVVNRGIGGDNTYGFLARLDDVVRLKPKYCFVMGGINDIFSDIPLDSVMANYRKILNVLTDEGIVPVVQSTLYVSPKWKRASEKNPDVTTLNTFLRSYCAQQQIEYIDLNAVLSKGEVLKDDYTFDGVHLTAAAYILWSAEIERVLTKLER
jgi:lysophospholipase L1-like esterase